MGSEVNTLWILVTAVLVFLMQAGFLCLETGLTRSKNNINAAMKNLTDFGLSTLMFWLFGFALMFGQTQGGIIGLSDFALDFEGDNLGHFAFFFFQVMFCGAAVTILAGAIAERVRFPAYLIMAVIGAGITYPIFGHWAWNGVEQRETLGWLAKAGFVDFAGSSVVHSLGGWIALAVLLIVGPRLDRFPKDGPPRKIPGADVPLATLGVMLLWFGWFGFNAGSALAINNDSVPRIIVNTIIASSSGMIVTLLVGWRIRGRAEIDLILNGTLAGAVAITANCHAVSLPSAIMIGSIGGMVMLGIDTLLERLRIDDAIGAIPVHLGAGIWGTLAVGIFGQPELLNTGLDRGGQILIQVIGIFVCGVWAFGLTYIVFKIIDRIYPLRVSAADEFTGLNVTEHGATTELFDLFTVMDEQSKTGNLSLRVPIEPFTEIGQIAERFNRVMGALEVVSTRTAAIVRTALDGIITFTDSVDALIIEGINPAVEKMFGYARQQIVGQPISLLLGADTATLPFDLNNLIRSGGYRVTIGSRSDGTIFPLEVVVTKASVGNVNFYTGTFRDITNRKQAEDQLREAKDAAEAASRSKSTFLANMSHELRTPLNAIIGYSEMLQEEAEDSETEAFIPDLRKIQTAGHHLLSLIKDILDISKIEAGRMELYLETFSTKAVIEDIVTTVTPLIEKKQNQLEIVIEDEAGEMHADLTKVRQIIINLLSNAAKFTENGRIKLKVEPAIINGVDFVNFSISDTGIGMTEDQIARLFEKFMQADASTTRKYGGTGLGLAISKAFCEMMGGGIEAESKYGEGTTFTIRLPRYVIKHTSQRDIVDTAPADSDQEDIAGGELTVLVIDDDAMVRDLIKRMMSREGLRVLTAASGEEGLRIASEVRPNIITLDVLMPGMDGWAVLTALKNAPALAEIPVIMLTMADSREVGFTLGASAFLVKPVERKALMSTINRFRRREGEIGRVLIVEDDDMTREMMRRTLEQEGWIAFEAANGRIALEILPASQPTFILLDLMMPEMDGFQFLAELRSLNAWRTVPVVVVTAKELDSREREQLSGSVERVIQKGMYTREALLNEVRDLIKTQMRS